MKKYFIDQSDKKKHESNASWFLGPQYEVLVEKAENLLEDAEINENEEENPNELIYSVFLTRASIENFCG